MILIPALNPQNAASTILVRATRIWESINRETKQVFHTNVVLVDEEGNQIVAVVRNTQKANCFPLVSEGKVYQISNAKVVTAAKAFRVVDRNVSLLIFHGTRIQPAADNGLIPRHKFELTPFEEVGRLMNTTTNLIDVIGLVTDYGNLEMIANGAQKLDIILENERNKKMAITLWEDKAQQFLGALHEAPSVPAFMVICGLLPKSFAGNPSLSSTDATKCYLNIDYKPLNDLRGMISASMGKSADLLGAPVNRPTVEANANNLKHLTIQEILGYHLPAGENMARCLCLAEIVAVLEEEGWYYNCCSKCSRKTRLLGQNNYCDNCAENVPELKQRYKLIVRVKDQSGSTTFTLFNKEVERLIRVPVEKVIAETDKDTIAATIPAVLKNVVGKTCVFDIKINNYNTNLGYEEYTVIKLSESSAGPANPTAEHGGPPEKRQRMS